MVWVEHARKSRQEREKKTGQIWKNKYLFSSDVCFVLHFAQDNFLDWESTILRKKDFKRFKKFKKDQNASLWLR